MVKNVYLGRYKVTLLTTANSPHNLLHLLQGKVRELESKITFTGMQTHVGWVNSTFLTMFEQGTFFHELLGFLLEIFCWCHYSEK